MFASAFTSSAGSNIFGNPGINNLGSESMTSSILCTNSITNIGNKNVFGLCNKSFGKYQSFSTSSSQGKTSSALSATVEDELDSALDDILGSAFEEAGEVDVSIKMEKRNFGDSNNRDAAVATPTEVCSYDICVIYCIFSNLFRLFFTFHGTNVNSINS